LDASPIPDRARAAAAVFDVLGRCDHLDAADGGLFMLWHAHQVIYDLDRTFKAQRVGAQQEQHLQQLISERGLADRAIHERHTQQS
jgi:hypothetical protein